VTGTLNNVETQTPQKRGLFDQLKQFFSGKKKTNEEQQYEREQKQQEQKQKQHEQEYEQLPRNFELPGDKNYNFQRVRVGQRDPYYAYISYIDDDKNETDGAFQYELPLLAGQLQRSNYQLYKQIKDNKKNSNPTTFESNTPGFDYFRNLLISQSPHLANRKITKIIITNKSLERRHGEGKTTEGLYDDEINEKMKHWTHFQGTIMRDEVDDIFKEAIANNWDRFGFIVNTDVRAGPGQHWTAIFVDLYKDRSIEFFDPFGDPPNKSIEHDIKDYIDALDLPYMLKYKVNSNKMQHEKSDRCGLHAMLFLEDRFRGVPFGEATGYVKKKALIDKSEHRAEKRKKGFGYV
jgi:hypothetical protein